MISHLHTHSHTLEHVPVGVVCDGVDVWWHLVAFLALVHLDDLLGVDGQHLVGIHHHAEEAGVRLSGCEREDDENSHCSFCDVLKLNNYRFLPQCHSIIFRESQNL